VARPLAAELGFMLLGKDLIKETLHDWLGPDHIDLVWSQRLGAASMELLWALAADAPAVVLEANFPAGDARVQRRLTGLSAPPVEVFCICPVEECMRRYATRAVDRHPVHLDSERGGDPDLYARSAQPLGLGPVIALDTTAPVDIPALAAHVRSRLAAVRA
jgi:hypothetical protein